jgi:hypothetical protein
MVKPVFSGTQAKQEPVCSRKFYVPRTWNLKDPNFKYAYQTEAACSEKVSVFCGSCIGRFCSKKYGSNLASHTSSMW